MIKVRISYILFYIIIFLSILLYFVQKLNTKGCSLWIPFSLDDVDVKTDPF